MQLWIVVGQAVVLNTDRDSGVLLTKDSGPFVPVKNHAFNEALKRGQVARYRGCVASVTEDPEPSLEPDTASVEVLELVRSDDTQAIMGESEDYESMDYLPTNEEREAVMARPNAVARFVELGLGQRTAEKLCDYGITNLDELQQASEDELMSIKGIGKGTVSEIMKLRS